jgi:hypothetical protein
VLHLLRHKRWSSRAEHERQSRKDEGCSTREAFVYHGTILKEESLTLRLRKAAMRSLKLPSDLMHDDEGQDRFSGAQ